MESNTSILNKNDLRSPVVLGFIGVYILAVVLVLLNEPGNALAYVGLSIGILFLCWLVIQLTKRIEVDEVEIGRPGLELLAGLLILVVWDLLPLPGIDFGDKWHLGFILKKSILLVGLPFLFLRIRKNSLACMGLTARNWKKNFWVGFLIFLAMAVPSGFFVGKTGSEIFSGEYTVAQFGVGFFVSFIYYLFMSGFSEEFFYRGFIQRRISHLLKSSAGGVLATSLIFGLLHIPNIMRWYPGTTIGEAFSRALFLQTLLGVLFGTLWERTRSLIPGVLVHSGVNGLNNVSDIVSKLVA